MNKLQLPGGKPQLCGGSSGVLIPVKQVTVPRSYAYRTILRDISFSLGNGASKHPSIIV